MSKFNQPSLVQWSSQRAINSKGKVKYWRAKTIGYSLLLSLSVVLAVLMGEKHDDLLLNITRPTSLYTIHADKSITNEYILLIENITPTNQTLKLSINHSDFEILRPHGEITIQGKKKQRIILIIKYIGEPQNLTHDLSIPITIELQGIDDPSISTKRENVFVYPQNNKNLKS